MYEIPFYWPFRMENNCRLLFTEVRYCLTVWGIEAKEAVMSESLVVSLHAACGAWVGWLWWVLMAAFSIGICVACVEEMRK